MNSWYVIFCVCLLSPSIVFRLSPSHSMNYNFISLSHQIIFHWLAVPPLFIHSASDGPLVLCSGFSVTIASVLISFLSVEQNSCHLHHREGTYVKEVKWPAKVRCQGSRPVLLSSSSSARVLGQSKELVQQLRHLLFMRSTEVQSHHNMLSPSTEPGISPEQVGCDSPNTKTTSTTITTTNH